MTDIITEELLERLTTDNVTATEQHNLVILKHKDHPFTISIAQHRLDKCSGTSILSLSNESIGEMATLEGLNYQEGTDIYKKAFAIDRDTPNKINLVTANGKRLENSYTKWFLHVNSIYVSYISMLIKVKKSKESSKEKIQEILKNCPNSKQSLRQVDKTTIENEYSELSVYNHSGSTELTINMSRLGDKGRAELFKLIDTLCK